MEESEENLTLHREVIFTKKDRLSTKRGALLFIKSLEYAFQGKSA